MYDPLLRMASALACVDAPEARVLLTELQQAQPLRPEAAQALRAQSPLIPILASATIASVRELTPSAR
jgi:hypothetical protein